MTCTVGIAKGQLVDWRAMKAHSPTMLLKHPIMR